MSVVNWLKKKKEEQDHLGTSEHNTEVENKLLLEAQNRYKLAREAKIAPDNTPLHDKWKKYDQIYRNKQWFGKVSEDQSTPVLNFTQSLIHSLIPRLTEHAPEAILRPRSSPGDLELAQKLQSVVHHLWYTNRMHEEKLSEAVLQALKYGTSIFKILWDPDMWDGLGDVKYSVVHPMNFFPDPRAYSMDTLEYCFTKVPKTMEYFSRRWSKGNLVAPENDVGDTEDLEGRGDYSGEDVANMMEYWFRDENGNVCVMYYAGNIVLDIMGGQYDKHKEFKDRPFYLHNRFPFSRICDYKVDKQFWGMGEIEITEMIQQIINSYEAAIIDNTRLMSNAQWIVNKTLSGLDEGDAWIFDNDPGGIIFTHNDGVRREAGVPIPHHIPEHLERLIFWMEQVTGIHDITQGRRPVGVRAASAIIALQEAANIRVREKAKNIECSIRDMTEQAIWLVLENYEEPRMIRMAGEMIPTTLDVREALEQRVMDMAQAAGMEQAFEMGGEIAPERQEELMGELMSQVKFPEFDVDVKVGASVPYSQAMLYEQAKEFYQLGIIDRRAVLDVSGFPNRDEILQRMEEMEGQVEEEERIGERTF